MIIYISIFYSMFFFFPVLYASLKKYTENNKTVSIVSFFTERYRLRPTEKSFDSETLKLQARFNFLCNNRSVYCWTCAVVGLGSCSFYTEYELFTEKISNQPHSETEPSGQDVECLPSFEFSRRYK